MSPSGWPKGKPRGKSTSEARRAADRKWAAAGVRARHRKKLRSVEISSGISLGGGLNEDFRAARAHQDISPAAWKSAHADIGDCEYVDDGLDEVFLRALRERVVYAQTLASHKEPPFQDVTIRTIAEVERYARKKEQSGPDPRKPSLPLPSKTHMTKLTLSARQLRIIGLLAAGMSAPQIAHELHIQIRTVKMHCDVLRSKLDVAHRREIPMAYRRRTGKDPFSLIPDMPKEREGSLLTAVVDSMFEEGVPRGKTLLAVVSEMFDPERST